MSSPTRTDRGARRGLHVVAAGVIALIALTGACSSSNPPVATDQSLPGQSAAPGQSTGPGADGTNPSTSGPGYEIVPDAQVATGLAEVRRLAAAIKAAQTTDPASADALVDQMYDTWFTFEGTVRKQEKNLYLQMEDGLSAIKAGVEQKNVTKIDKGIKDLEEGAAGYLKAHP